MSTSQAAVSEAVQTIIEAAAGRRMVEIDYRKPGRSEPTRRLVEPYRFEAAGPRMMVRCWQVRPEALNETSWRTFRIDRIEAARDGGRVFEPRIDITITSGEVEPFIYGYRPTAEQTPAQRYAGRLERALLEDRPGEADLAEARRLADPLDRDTLRAVHARLFRDVLDDVLVDGGLDDAEEAYLRRVAALLGRLGWSPAAEA